ncbi:pyridine nucleotide-disulfide oxidoreductase [Kordia periserrulae]|uniref:Pyridine nucleotide-disulfide oxidoreductase n=1 Tax=Kordia periserrulae TaxID=701523 RepID=A0A2T6C764_9FLAO|nr:FAD-dependent oxidoreductase [Kordia periserrulae]PTX64160.1 pyridine nucleotide-disulfide oxidoreductase [Kordia periserrulae]
MFDVLIIGGGVSGMQCALVLGSAKEKPFATDKKIGIVMHQRASHLQNALFNNVLGLPAGKTGAEILIEGQKQLAETYPHVTQITQEKVLKISGEAGNFQIVTNKKTYQSKLVVIALNYAKPLTIDGLDDFTAPHPRAAATKDRVYLKNNDHVVKEGMYACGTIAGWRSQFAIAAGSGAQVATDILTLWNDGNHTKVHDKI